jgi:hypothetical protein
MMPGVGEKPRGLSFALAFRATYRPAPLGRAAIGRIMTRAGAPVHSGAIAHGGIQYSMRAK